MAVLPLKIELLGLESITHLRQGDSKAAQATAAAALALTEKATPSFYAAISGYTGPAEVYLELWERKDTTPSMNKLANPAIQTLGKYARVFPIGGPRFQLYQGRYAFLTNKPQQAQKNWQESLALATRLGMVYDRGLAYYEIARHLPAGDAERRHHRDSAIEIFRVNAAYDLERPRQI